MAKKKAKTVVEDVSLMTTETIKFRLQEAGIELPKTRNRQVFIDLYNKTFNSKHETAMENNEPNEAINIPSFDEVTQDVPETMPEIPEITHSDPEYQKQKEELKADREKLQAKMSEGVKKSWDVPEIAAARKLRRSCMVTYNDPAGNEVRMPFDSVLKAFEHFGLQRSKHYKLRKELRTISAETGILYEENGKKYFFQDMDPVMVPKEEKPEVKKRQKKAKEAAEVAVEEAAEAAVVEPQTDVEPSFDE
jgi:hypothetical protein